VASRAATWTRAPRTRLLPDRFVFSGYSGGRLAWRAEGADIPDALALGFAPPAEGEPPRPDGLPWDAASRWLVDYDEAVRVGMAITVPDPSEDGYELVTAVGVVADADADATAAHWQEALRAHQYTDGLAALAVETPTNNTPATRSAWSSRPEARSPEDVELGLAGFDPDSEQPAARAARAFGVDGTEVLARVPGALGTVPGDPAAPDDEAVLTNLHTIIGRLAGISDMWKDVSEPEGFVDFVAAGLGFVVDHFIAHVRARGQLPTLRIGRQPYGLLTVSSPDLWRGDDVHPLLLDNIDSVLTTVQEMVDRVPRIGPFADQDKVVLDLLSRRGISRRLRGGGPGLGDEFRPRAASVIGTATAGSMFAEQIATDPSFSFDKAVDEAPSQALLDTIAMRPLANQLRLMKEFTARLDAWDPHDPEPDQLDLELQYDELEQALLTLERQGLEDPFSDFIGCLRGIWALNRLATKVRRRAEAGIEPNDDDGSRGEFETWQQRAAAHPVFMEVHERLAGLEELAQKDLSRVQALLIEALDTISHRVDAWVTSVAAARLTRLREERAGGLRLGAYGWLTDVQHTHDDRTSDGYVMTPSLQHATTAAVLRSGFLAHSDPSAMAVDAQSWRVRSALAVLDGVRGGQPLAALLGYQFERGLHDHELDVLIAGFRSAYPFAPTAEPDVTDEARASIGARDVVDGQALRRDLAAVDAAFNGAPESAKPGIAALAAATSAEASAIVRRLLSELDEAVDAVGDLLLAESVHHLVGGNPLRAGMSADAIGRGDGLPQDFEAIRTPRSAAVVTYHLGLVAGGGLPAGRAAGAPTGGSPGSSRRSNGGAGRAWATRRAGDSTASCTSASAPPTAATVSLADLGLCALEVVTAALPADGGSPLVAAVLAHGGAGASATLSAAGGERMTELALLCERLRAILAAGTPLLASHLDPALHDGWGAADLGELHDRVAPWIDDVLAARDGLRRARDAADHAAIREALAALADLGVVAAVALPGTDPADQATQILDRIEAAALEPLAPPPDADSASAPDRLAWGTAVTGAVSASSATRSRPSPCSPTHGPRHAAARRRGRRPRGLAARRRPCAPARRDAERRPRRGGDPRRRTGRGLRRRADPDRPRRTPGPLGGHGGRRERSLRARVGRPGPRRRARRAGRRAAARLVGGADPAAGRRPRARGDRRAGLPLRPPRRPRPTGAARRRAAGSVARLAPRGRPRHRRGHADARPRALARPRRHARAPLGAPDEPRPPARGNMRAIETIPRMQGIEDGLAARVQDPLWALARQWQFAEFRAEDVGSIARVDLDVEAHAVDEWRPAGERGWRPYRPAEHPLERLVEEEPATVDPRLRLDGGRRLGRLLDAAGIGELLGMFRSGCGFADDGPLAPAGLAARLRRRVPDGARLAPSLALLAEHTTQLARAEATRLGLPDDARAAVAAVAAEWLDWWRPRAPAEPAAAPGAPAAWDAHRLEYALALRSSTLPGLQLTAREYPAAAWTGGRSTR
jgi:hypothetical protein